MDRIDRLEQEACEARDSAAAHAEAIGERLDPANWFRPVRDAGQDVARLAERVAREHPAALGAAALAAVGLFALTRSRGDRHRQGWKPAHAVGEAGRAARREARHAAADVAHAARTASARAGDLLHEARERAGDAAAAAGHQAEELARVAAQRAQAALRAAGQGAQALGRQARHGADWAVHEAKEHPLAALAAAGLAAGAVLALVLDRGDEG